MWIGRSSRTGIVWHRTDRTPTSAFRYPPSTRPPCMSRRIRLGESLVEAGLINVAQLDEALARRTTTGERIGESLVALGYISERDLVRTLAKDADIPFLDGGDLRVDSAVISIVPAQVARTHNLVPFSAD